MSISLKRSLFVLSCALALPSLASAQQQDGGMGQPAPSMMIKRTINETDPIKAILDKKKALSLTKVQEDTMKALGKEMRHMQDLVYEDIDRAAKKDKDAEKARTPASANLMQEKITRLQDIQMAYRDRARTFLSAEQIVLNDSLEKDRNERGSKKR